MNTIIMAIIREIAVKAKAVSILLKIDFWSSVSYKKIAKGMMNTMNKAMIPYTNNQKYPKWR